MVIRVQASICGSASLNMCFLSLEPRWLPQVHLSHLHSSQYKEEKWEKKEHRVHISVS